MSKFSRLNEDTPSPSSDSDSLEVTVITRQPQTSPANFQDGPATAPPSPAVVAVLTRPPPPPPIQTDAVPTRDNIDDSMEIVDDWGQPVDQRQQASVVDIVDDWGQPVDQRRQASVVDDWGQSIEQRQQATVVEADDWGIVDIPVRRATPHPAAGDTADNNNQESARTFLPRPRSAGRYRMLEDVNILRRANAEIADRLTQVAAQLQLSIAEAEEDATSDDSWTGAGRAWP